MYSGSIRAQDQGRSPLALPPALSPMHLPWQGCASPTTGGSPEIYSLEKVVVVVVIIKHLTGKIRIEGTSAVFFKWKLNKHTCTVVDTSLAFLSHLTPEHWQQDLYLSDSR